MSKKEQMAAIDEALSLAPTDEDEGFDPVEILDVNDDPTVDPEAKEETPDAEDEPVAEGEGEVPDGEDAEDEAPAAESEELEEEPDPDDDAVDPEPKAEEKSDAEKALEEGSKRPSDEFGDLDKDAAPKTRERFETMKKRFDEVSERARDFEEKNTTWMETINATGTNPEQLGKTFEYLEAVNSQDPEKMEVAYQTMMAEMQALGRLLGKEAPGYSPLDEYDDLKQKVDDGYLDSEDAMEIARARAQLRVREANQSKVQEGRQQQDAKQQAHQELSALGNQLRADDPMFNQKAPALQNYIREMVREGVSPAEWARAAKIFYKSIPDVAPAKPSRAPAPNSVRPGSGGGSSGGLKKEPGSEMEALEMALENMPKR